MAVEPGRSGKTTHRRQAFRPEIRNNPSWLLQPTGGLHDVATDTCGAEQVVTGSFVDLPPVAHRKFRANGKTCRTGVSTMLSRRRFAGLAAASPPRRRAARPWSVARERHLRHELAGASGAWRLLPGRRRRHLPQARPRRAHRARRASGEQPDAAAQSAASTSTMGGNMLQAFSACVLENIPTIVVAASFQKEPQVAHRSSERRLRNLRGPEEVERHLCVPRKDSPRSTKWMKSEHGFREELTKPYTFSPAPFLANKKAVMQGLSLL